MNYTNQVAVEGESLIHRKPVAVAIRILPMMAAHLSPTNIKLLITTIYGKYITPNFHISY